jgi:hypothetical protein
VSPPRPRAALAYLAGILLTTVITPSRAQERDAEAPTSPVVAPESLVERRNYYVEARSYGTRREPELPPYARRLSQVGIDALRSVDWLEFGLDYRSRFEYRENDFNRAVATVDVPVLSRTRAYLGLREILDPLRFTIELEDARRYNGAFPRDDRDFNVFEPIQLLGELYFKDLFGPGQPLSIRAGRMAFELVDRRLIARNGWRNTTNTFQGFRVLLNQEESPWQLDLFALQPLERLLYEIDQPGEGQWLLGFVGNWRRWSRVVTLQPYYLRLRQAERGTTRARDVHAAALRGYGIIASTGFDYDVGVVYQFGHHEGLRHGALGFTAEVGYAMKHPFKPRISASYGHGSGDQSPEDRTNQRFDRMFGFARPFSNNIYFQWENMRTPKLRLEFEPDRRLRLDMGYGAFWLDSPTDRWNNAGLRDPRGGSGDFIGHELDVQVRTRPLPRVDVNLGYAFFRPGGFPRNLGRARSSHFLYLELMMRVFR